MGDDADGHVLQVEALQGSDDHFQAIRVEAAEAFVEKEELQGITVAELDLLGQGQRQAREARNVSPPDRVEVGRLLPPL
jgi:hypothetical protein